MRSLRCNRGERLVSAFGGVLWKVERGREKGREEKDEKSTQAVYFLFRQKGLNKTMTKRQKTLENLIDDIRKHYFNSARDFLRQSLIRVAREAVRASRFKQDSQKPMKKEKEIKGQKQQGKIRKEWNIIEELAKLEHEHWAGVKTPYEKLTEKEKESNRKRARKIINKCLLIMIMGKEGTLYVHSNKKGVTAEQLKAIIKIAEELYE